LDTFALPFVQGWLRKETLKVRIETKCACCSKAMTLDIDSKLNIKVHESLARPLVFIPPIIQGAIFKMGNSL